MRRCVGGLARVVGASRGPAAVLNVALAAMNPEGTQAADVAAPRRTLARHGLRNRCPH